MSVPTPELGLSQAVDADDTADYLVTNLANSLTTVDSLFNNATGHTHAGAHQGGPITSAGVADGSITNAKLGPDVARANLLTNGGFEIWQRGNGPFTGTSFTADRWAPGAIGTDTLSISADTTNTDGPGTAMAVTYTLGTGGNSFVYQPLVPGDGEINNLRGLTVSASMRIRTATPNAVRLGGYNGSAWNYSAYHPGDGTYHTLTYTWTIQTNAPYFHVAVFFAVSCTAYLDNACVVVGSQPANYVPLHPADDLNRCLRYYELTQLASNYLCTAFAYSPTQAMGMYPIFVPKAVTPTVTVSVPTTWQVTNGAFSPITCTAMSGGLQNRFVAMNGTVASGLTAGQGAMILTIPAGAQLTVEANP